MEIGHKELTGNMCLAFVVFIYFCSFIKYFLMQPQGCQFVQIYRGCQHHPAGYKTREKVQQKNKKPYITDVLC